MKKIAMFFKEYRSTLLAVAIAVLLTAGITVAASSLSLKELIAQYTGQVLADNITQELKASGQLNAGLDTEGLNLGAASPDIHFNQSNGFFISSTTPFAVQNPFNATTSVFALVYNQTGPATTTYGLNCGTSSNGYIAVTTGKLINVTAVATSGLPMIMSGTLNATGGDQSGTVGFPRIMVGPTEWVICTISSVSGYAYAGTDAFTSAVSTFAGKYWIEWFNWPK